MASLDLSTVVKDFAQGIEKADEKKPQAINQRSKKPFRPGIGPHTEANTVELVLEELAARYPDRYSNYSLAEPYPDKARQSCDICLGTRPEWDWAIEVKMVRFLGDNGKANDNILMHVLSPYSSHRSALTDCAKLIDSAIALKKAILIYGFDHDDWPLDLAIKAFETLARSQFRLGDRLTGGFDNLIHPVHARGRVFAWQLLGDAN